MRTRITRIATAGFTAGVLALTAAGPAAAQGLPDLPTAPSGAVGEILSPLEDLIGEITGPLGDALGDVPLDNAVTLSGTDAVEAAVALSRITFPESQIAFVGRDDVFADTLSSVAGQGIAGAPLLLTQTDGIDPRTTDELTRLGVTEVVILGAEQAISAAVEDELVGIYGADNVTRVGGPSRIETAADLASVIAPQAAHVVMMRAYPSEGADQSQAYADALSAGPLASNLELPSLLTTTDYLHTATEEYLRSAGVEQVTLIGGEAAISPDVENTLLDMGVTVTRVAGDNRWDTSVRIANAMGMLDVSDANRVILSEGGAVAEPLWAAGFAAAAHGAVYQSPVLLVDGPLLPPETISFIGDGLIANALRVNNEPVICNSFVDFLACETVALMMLGTLDAANELAGGAIGSVLGPVLEPLAEALDGILPGPDGTSPGLVGQILAIIGVGGTEEEPESDLCSDGLDNDEDGEIDEADECEAASEESADAQFAAAMADQPVEVRNAFTEMMGAEGDRVSPSEQGVLIRILSDLSDALGGPVDTSNPAQAAALVDVLESINAVVGDRSGNIPLGELTSLLEGVELLTADLADVVALGSLIEELGTDTLPVVEDLTTIVGGFLSTSARFHEVERDLVSTYGPEAQRLANVINRLTQ